MVIGYPTGGRNDIYARAVARHIGKHIPGNPTVIPRNMPGGGSLVAANHVFNVAPKDGTTLVARSRRQSRWRSGWACPNVKLKTAEFNWIGRVAPSVNMTFVMATRAGEDHPGHVQARGHARRQRPQSSTVAIYPAVLANVIGAKFKMVMGYPSSTASMLAMERGEVEGHSTSLEVVRATASGMAAGEEDHAAGAVCAQAASGAAGRADVLGARAATTRSGRSCAIVANATEVGKMILSTPDTPADRIQALRRAFDATMKDPAFMAELKAQRVELGPMPGEELQKLVVEVGTVSPAIIDKVKAIYPLN